MQATGQSRKPGRWRKGRGWGKELLGLVFAGLLLGSFLGGVGGANDYQSVSGNAAGGAGGADSFHNWGSWEEMRSEKLD
jgi:hypothetical protein